MNFINTIIDQYNIPLLTAFLLGILTSISPCPLATNITAIAFISKEIKTLKHTLFNAFFYILGRGLTYTLLATLIYFGWSSFDVSNIFQGWGEKILGPILILISLIMFGVIKLNLKVKNEKLEKFKLSLTQKGYWGTFLLGVIFALAFCPYSGVLFFGVLIPFVLNSSEGLFLPPLFAIGTGLPVLLFSILLVFSMQKLGQAFKVAQKIEKGMRYLIASVFIIIGFYYIYFLIRALFKI